MIHTNRIVTVGRTRSAIDKPIVLYRGDREVEVEFTLAGNAFTFSEEGNVIKSVNASHGQLVLNTPSGEHMFSELAECHEGKVVFVITKEMIDEFIETGFYSFQIRLYDSAEMKSRVTIPPVMNGFDIRNPIAAEDETNVVDQGIVDYARIFKDQSNEELPTFDWQGNYNKTEWTHHDVITENKMNKIEDALYSINANVKESDAIMLNALDNVKKDADKYVKEHMAEVEADVEEFERNLNTGVEKFKVDTNAAMTAHKNEVSEELESVNSQLAQNAKYEVNIPIECEFEELENFINSNSGKHIKFPYGKLYVVTKQLILNNHINTSIDFNNCSFKVADNSSISSRYVGDISIGDISIAICNSSNILIENIILNGNRINNSDNLTQTGVHIQNVNGLIIRNINVESFMDKMFTIYHNTKNINISNVTMRDLGNGTAPAYFFVSNGEDGSYNIKDVYIDNDEILNTAQIFYIAGYNGVIENIKARNVSSVLDFRKGRHTVRNVVVDNCDFVFTVQKYPGEEAVGLCDVIIENVNATGVNGQQSGTTGAYIVDCNSCFINNLIIEMNVSSEYNWYGIRLKEGAGGSNTSIKNVNISNTTIINAKTSSVRVDDIINAIYLNNIKHINNYYTTSLPVGINGSGMSGIMVICSNFATEGEVQYKVAMAITSNVYMPYSHNLLSSNTNNRPAIQNYREVGYCLFDTTLNKPIWWNGTKWVDSTGANV